MASLRILLPSIPIVHYIILLILIQKPPHVSSYDYYKDCNKLFSCGVTRNLGFPFWGDDRPEGCGHPLLHLTCEKNISHINIKDVTYQVLEANPNENALRITRDDYLHLQGICPSKLVNTSLDTDLFVYGSNYKNLTLLYGCSASNAFPFTAEFLPCIENGSSGDHVYTQFGSPAPPVFCKASVFFPVPPSFNDNNEFSKIQEAIRDGFMVRWIAGIADCEKCKISGGVCGYNWISSQTTCYLPDAKAPRSQSLEPPPPESQ